MTKTAIIDRLIKEYPVGECVRITEAQLLELMEADAIKQVDDIPSEIFDHYFTPEIMAKMSIATDEDIKKAVKLKK